MMKITLKISPEALSLIHQLTLIECRSKAYNHSDKCKKSLCMELFEILAKKCISYTKNPNGKPRILSLKYHLAYYLYELLMAENYYRILSIYEANKLDMLKNNLHQLL